MNIHLSTSRANLPRLLLFAFLLAFLINISAPTSAAKVQRKNKTTPKPNPEKKFLRNILGDQRAIWTAPFHLHSSDGKWLAPLGLSTVALITTDRRTSGELVENGDNLERLRISKSISRFGSLYATAGAAGVFYLTGRATHNDRLRETGVLGAEALIDSALVVQALKTASQRQRPPVDDSSGEFFDGGSSFPSGHAISAWSLATVVAQEYGHRRPMVQIAAYGLATAVSLSRYTGRNHFLSDVLVGSALGYGIGRYVYHKHHDPELDAHNENDNNYSARSKLFPRIVPLYNARAHTYGGMLTWNF
ncbi:MAG TPA: phosphatase PAP2 family protein [Pyrinomonadaceae bacterium]|jgi:membrane-associated phospholipid phosphatase|nr:phosphatase PAP2 family protein [Pyrinomonadaceae bacterium]